MTTTEFIALLLSLYTESDTVHYEELLRNPALLFVNLSSGLCVPTRRDWDVCMARCRIRQRNERWPAWTLSLEMMSTVRVLNFNKVEVRVKEGEETPKKVHHCVLKYVDCL